MEKRNRERVFWSNPEAWIPIDWTWNDGFQQITERTIYDALTDEDMLSDQRNRILEETDRKKIEKIRTQIQREKK
jgi:hypothetical protein